MKAPTAYNIYDTIRNSHPEWNDDSPPNLQWRKANALEKLLSTAYLLRIHYLLKPVANAEDKSKFFIKRACKRSQMFLNHLSEIWKRES